MAEPLPPPIRMISVYGEASEEVAPDQAVLSGELVSRDKKLATAKETNDRLAKRVLEIAKQYNIPKEKIAASNVYIRPDYRWNQPENRQEQIGYIVSRSLSITIERLEIHERLLSALLENGIDQINGVHFTVANPEVRTAKLQVKALENARKQAQMLAEAAKAKLGKVLFITTQSATLPPMPMMMAARSMEMAKAEGASTAPSLPGLVTLRESVSVSYELE